MSSQTIIYLVLGLSALASFGLWVGLVIVPVCGTYSRLWQRTAAAFLGAYVLIALIVIGISLGVLGLWYFDEL